MNNIRKYILEQTKDLNELFVKLPDARTDKDLIRLAMAAELDAASLYERMAARAQDPGLKKVLLDIAHEEKIHIEEFETLLYKLDPDHVRASAKGKEEVADLLGDTKK